MEIKRIRRNGRLHRRSRTMQRLSPGGSLQGVSGSQLPFLPCAAARFPRPAEARRKLFRSKASASMQPRWPLFICCIYRASSRLIQQSTVIGTEVDRTGSRTASRRGLQGNSQAVPLLERRSPPCQPHTRIGVSCTLRYQLPCCRRLGSSACTGVACDVPFRSAVGATAALGGSTQDRLRIR
jgi:hypothetical protein